MTERRVEWDDRGPRFLDAEPALAPGGVTLFGVPYDGTSSFRPGARFGPDALRDASVGLESYSPVQDRDLRDAPFADIGNLAVSFADPSAVVDLVERAVDEIASSGGVPLAFGGEHTLTVGVVRALAARHDGLVLVQLDAHADLRPEYLGSPFSHACTMRRCLEVVGPSSLLQVGVRSGTREEFAELRSTDRLLPPHADTFRGRLEGLGRRPIYLTVDLDVFDPGLLPGTGTPEPGGIGWDRFDALLGAIPEGALVGADVVELAPQLDPSGCSAIAAARIARELIVKLSAGVDRRTGPGSTHPPAGRH